MVRNISSWIRRSPKEKADRLVESFQDGVHHQLVLILRGCDVEQQVPYEFVQHHHIVKERHFRFHCMKGDPFGSAYQPSFWEITGYASS
jgi:hypothetical protein